MLPLIDTAFTCIVPFSICNYPEEWLHGLFLFVRCRYCVMKRLIYLSETTEPVKAKLNSFNL